MSNKTPMTVHGAERLKTELENLKRVERPAVIQAISEARAHGDLKENAEYHAAKEHQSFLEGRIADIEGKLSNCQVIDPMLLNTDKVVFGATVALVNVDTDEEVTYQIVGMDEADIKDGKISISSPIARALIGKLEGEEACVETPAGSTVYEITKVLFK